MKLNTSTLAAVNSLAARAGAITKNISNRFAEIDTAHRRIDEIDAQIREAGLQVQIAATSMDLRELERMQAHLTKLRESRESLTAQIASWVQSADSLLAPVFEGLQFASVAARLLAAIEIEYRDGSASASRIMRAGQIEF